MTSSDIPKKANRVLHFILLAFLLILIRIWYLCVIEHETYLELSKKPQKKTSLEKPLRGTIRDRFNIPLAVNKLQYDAAICYDHIRQIPSIKRIKDTNGKLVKRYLRREYIEKLSFLLAKELELDPIDIEDFIYGKASLFPSTAFVLKEDISEKTYYYLKGLERSYAGICALKNLKRFYPQKKIGADLIGYIGSINEREYFTIAHEIKELQNYLSQQEQGDLVFLPKGFSSLKDIKDRVQFLKSKMYQFNDKLGKAGIEAIFDDSLRGFYGKKAFEVNTKGSIVRELPGSKKPISGQRLLLNISAELQEFAEALLAENESIRDQRFPNAGKNHTFITPPWIKGGAIVAMIPTTGEIVAMASYPRTDNNDFTLPNPISQSKISRWLENKNHIRDLWDGKSLLERELYSFTNHSFYKEEKKLTLDHYLERILSLQSQAKKAMQKISSLSIAVEFQKACSLLLDLSEQPYMHALIDALYTKDLQHKPSSFSTNEQQIHYIQEALSQHELLVKEKRSFIDNFLLNIPYNDDKLLILDLARLIAPASSFDTSLLEIVGSESLSIYRKLSQALVVITAEVKLCAKNYFHLHDFRTWRESHFKSYLAEKRLEEKEKKTYQKPYIDYLKKIEDDQFKDFWKENKWDLIQLFLKENCFSENNPPLSAYFKHYKETLKNTASSNHQYLTALELLQSRLKTLENPTDISYLKTMRGYQDLSEKLYGYYSQIKKRRGMQTEKDLAGAFYPPEGYGFGRSYAFRQSTPLGSIFKIITAYEALKQNYERGFYEHTKDLNPLTIIDEIQPSQKLDRNTVLGFHADGTKITRHYKGGTLPRTHTASLGKVDYIKAFERSSNIYFSLLASDVIQDPNDLSLASLKFGFGNKTGIDLPGEICGVLPKDLNENRTGLYAFAIGQHSLIATPLQTSVMLSSLVNGGEVLKPQIIHLTAGVKNSTSSLFSGNIYPYQDYLNRVGIFFPFFIQTQQEEKNMDIKLFEKTLYRKLFLPDNIKDYLLEGLHSVVSSPRGAARAELIRYLHNNTRAMRNYLKLKHQLAGKTSSAEIAYHPTLDRECPPILCKDIWFGGIAFKAPEESSVVAKQQDDIPELVVVVYLRFGGFGKETAPLAGEIVNKWREICKKHGKSSYIFSDF